MTSITVDDQQENRRMVQQNHLTAVQQASMKNFGLNRVLWTITTLLVLVAATLGVVSYPGIYSKVMTSNLLPGAFAQDLLTIIISLGMLLLISTAKQEDYRKQIIIMGVIGSFWYLYAIYSIERVYNIAYYLYLAILSSSSWTTGYSISSLKSDFVASVSVPRSLRFVSAGFSGAIAVVFVSLWASALYPLVSTGTKIDFYYSIYILDLCLIMPAFVVTSTLLFRKRGLGVLMTPVMYIVGIFVILPLGLGEVAKLYFGLAPDNASMVMSFAFSTLFVILASLNLRYVKRLES